MDVDKVERKLLALYQKMVGPGVWPRTHVIEWDAFLLIIKTNIIQNYQTFIMRLSLVKQMFLL